MDTLRLIGEIQYDLDTGVYDRFPKSKKRMHHISNKLAICHYVENKEMSSGEIETIRNEGYYID